MPSTDELRQKIQLDIQRPFLDGYRIGSLILAIYYLVLIPFYLISAPHPIADIMSVVNAIAFLILLASHLLLKTGRVKPSQGPQIALAVIIVALCQIIANMALNRDIYLTSDLMLLIAASPLVFYRGFHFIAILVFTVIVWLVAIYLLPHQDNLAHWIVGMASAALVSIAIHIIQRRILLSQEDLRLQDLLRESEKAELIEKLELALENVKTLRGLIPICAHCKKVRNDTGYWQQVEQYVKERSEARFSHGICPDCEPKIRAELVKQGLLPKPIDGSSPP